MTTASLLDRSYGAFTIGVDHRVIDHLRRFASMVRERHLIDIAEAAAATTLTLRACDHALAARTIELREWIRLEGRLRDALGGGSIAVEDGGYRLTVELAPHGGSYQLEPIPPPRPWYLRLLDHFMQRVPVP